MASKKSINLDKEYLLINLFNANFNIDEIAKQLDVGKMTIASKIKELGLKRDFSEVKPTSLLQGKYNKIKKMLKNGYSF